MFPEAFFKASKRRVSLVVPGKVISTRRNFDSSRFNLFGRGVPDSGMDFGSFLRDKLTYQKITIHIFLLFRDIEWYLGPDFLPLL